MKYKFLIALLVSFVPFLSVFAVSNLAEEGLTISPPILELSIKEGESVDQTIRLTNPTDGLVEVYPKTMNFKAAGEGGEPYFFEDRGDAPGSSVASWINFDQSKIALAPEQVVEFSYTINVPKGAEPGGHYGVVFFATEPPENERGASQVALGSMIGSLLLVSVPGQIVEKGIIEEFQTDKKVYFKPPVSLSTRITNIGNVHFKPRGEILVDGWFGESEKTITFNEGNGNVLPDSTRRFENSWGFSPFVFGYFTVSANLAYGENGRALAESTGFWIIPWWLIAIFVIILGIITFFTVRHFRKKSKKTKIKESKKNDISRPSSPSEGPVLR